MVIAKSNDENYKVELKGEAGSALVDVLKSIGGTGEGI